MIEYVKIKAIDDRNDDVHLRGPGRIDKTLCGHRTTGQFSDGEVSCTRCLQLARNAN
jgi:hypothetical protein